MKTIEIDDELYAYLQSKAIPFVETPNLTLKRLLLGDNAVKTTETQNDQPVSNKSVRKIRIRKKQPKTDLPKLIQAGLLEEGQRLYLYDYQGNKLGGHEATVSGKNLLWDNKLFSMSELAKELLKQEGFSSESVRGPAHWYNNDGISVKDLWASYLSRN